MDFMSWKYRNIASAMFLSILIGFFYCSVTTNNFFNFSDHQSISFDLGYLFGSISLQWALSLIITSIYWLFKKKSTKFSTAWIKCTLGITFVFFLLAYHMMGNPYYAPRNDDHASNIQSIPCQGAEALNACRLKAEQGVIQTQFNLGLLYERGDGVPQDYIEARKWYQMAADQGSAEAQVGLGLLYAQGQGVTQDYIEAKRWFQKAADQGNAKAKSSLGILYAQGLGVPKDEKMAKALIQEATTQGDTTVGDFALSILADPTSPYYSEAVDAAKEEVNKLHALADQGDAEAQSNLGDIYVEGTIIPQDYKQAVIWWRKAANQGLARAQYNLGVSYANGSGVMQDYAEARKWLQKAADQGNVKAQTALQKINSGH